MQSTPIPYQNLLDTSKSSSERIYLSPPDIGLEEKELVMEAMESNWIAPEGPTIKTFEHELSQYLGTEHVIALNSGTSAIHLGLKLLGVGQDDLVIVPTFSFCAAVNPVLYLNAIPVFVDCENSNWGLDPEILEEAIKNCINTGSKPKAIVIVHSYGMPAKMDELRIISEKYQVPILEDAAESLGSMYKGQQTGTFGALSVLSFNGNKVLTTGGGGALILPDRHSYEKVLKWSTQSKEALPYYHHIELGFNYRISNIAAAIGLGQFKNLQNRIINKRLIHDQYVNNLSEIQGLSFFEDDSDCTSNKWLTILNINSSVAGKNNLEICEELEELGIESRPVWQPLHKQPLYRKYKSFIKGKAEQLFSVGLCLPSGSALSDNQVEYVSTAIKSILHK